MGHRSKKCIDPQKYCPGTQYRQGETIRTLIESIKWNNIPEFTGFHIIRG